MSSCSTPHSTSSRKRELAEDDGGGGNSGSNVRLGKRVRGEGMRSDSVRGDHSRTKRGSGDDGNEVRPLSKSDGEPDRSVERTRKRK